MLKTLVSTDNLSYEEWLQYRRKGIGGSDVSIITGINKYKSVYQLWLDKTNQIEPEEAGEAAYWGHVLEPIVRNEFSKRTGYPVDEPREIFQHPEYPFMLANLDGIIHDVDGKGPYIFEAKTASYFASDDWDLSIPEAYLLQIQHYMAVTGYLGTYIAVLIGGNTFKYYFVERDDQLIALIIDLERYFWDLVETMTPPELTGKNHDSQFLSKQYPEAIINEILKLPEETKYLIEDYEATTEKIDVLTELRDQAINKIKLLLGDHQEGVIDDFTITWKNVVTNRFDAKSLKQEEPDLYIKHLKSSLSRRFSIKKKG